MLKSIKRCCMAIIVCCISILGISYMSHQTIMKMSGAFEKFS